MENSGLAPVCRVRKVPFKVRNRVLTLRDVKNEGTSGDVYENKGSMTKCTPIVRAFYRKFGDLTVNERPERGSYTQNAPLGR
jgi:hypothetical protein